MLAWWRDTLAFLYTNSDILYIKNNNAVSQHAGAIQNILCYVIELKKKARRRHTVCLTSLFPLSLCCHLRISQSLPVHPSHLHLLLPFKYRALRWEPEGRGEMCLRLMRRSPQLHGASASPACRHAAIHRLITME